MAGGRSTVQGEGDGELAVAPETGEERGGQVLACFPSLGEVESSATLAAASGRAKSQDAGQLKAQCDQHE